MKLYKRKIKEMWCKYENKKPSPLTCIYRKEVQKRKGCANCKRIVIYGKKVYGGLNGNKPENISKTKTFNKSKATKPN